MSKLPSLILESQRDATGELALVFEHSALWQTAQLATLNDIVRAFVNAGENGAYPQAGTRPGDSALTLLSPVMISNKENGEVAVCSVHARRVSGRAYQVLRNMVARADYDGSSLRRISVREFGAGTARQILPIIDEENEDEQYPAASEFPGFEIEWADLEGSKRRRVLVEFASELRRSDFDLLAVPIGQWASLLTGGGFAMPFDVPDQVESVMGLTTLFDSYTAEIEVPIYMASEAGWDCLINLLAVFGRRTLRIVRVEIE